MAPMQSKSCIAYVLHVKYTPTTAGKLARNYESNDIADDKSRPETFFVSRLPGSLSPWLHMPRVNGAVNPQELTAS